MMSGDLIEIRKVIADLEAEKNQALCINQNLNEEICCLKKEICEHKRCEEMMRDDLEETCCKMNNLKKKNCQLEQCLQVKEREICEMQKLCSKIDELNAYICCLEKDLKSHEKHSCCLQEQVTELERCVHEKDCYIGCLEKKVQELECCICNLEQEIRALHEENECLKNELEECKCCVEKKQMEINCLCQRLNQCECEKQKLCCQLEKIQTCLDETTCALQKEQNCNCKLKDQLKCSQAENHKLCMENQCLREENFELCKKLDCVNKNLLKCQCEYEKMLMECNDFKKSIGEFKKQIVNDLKGPCCVPCSPCPCPSPTCCIEEPKCMKSKFGRNRANYRKSVPRCSFTCNNVKCDSIIGLHERKSKRGGTISAPQRSYGANRKSCKKYPEF